MSHLIQVSPQQGVRLTSSGCQPELNSHSFTLIVTVAHLNDCKNYSMTKTECAEHGGLLQPN